MDAQGMMRLMFDTMNAYDRADFDRLAEIYAEDAQWLNADPSGPHCHHRDDIFAMFRQRSVFSFQGRRIVTVNDYPSMEAAEAEMAGPSQAPG
jgi:ketosteroid isomerase-like protein